MTSNKAHTIMEGRANLVSAAGGAGNDQETGERQAQHGDGNVCPSTSHEQACKVLREGLGMIAKWSRIYANNALEAKDPSSFRFAGLEGDATRAITQADAILAGTEQVQNTLSVKPIMGDASARKDEDSGPANDPQVKCNGLAPASPAPACNYCKDVEEFSDCSHPPKDERREA